MLKKNVRSVLTFVLPFGLVIALVIMILVHVSDTKARISVLTNDALHSSVSTQKDLLSVKLSGEFALLNVVSASIQTEEALASPEMVQRMKQTVAASDISLLIAADRFGNGVTSEGRNVSISGQDYFLHTREGGQSILFADSSNPEAGNDSIVLSVPVQVNGNNIGVLTGMLDGSVLHDILGQNVYEGGDTFLCDGTGHILLAGAASGDEDDIQEGSDLFSMLQSGENGSETPDVQMVTDIRTGTEGSAEYRIGGEQRIIAYVPLGYNGWMVCSSVPTEKIVLFARIEREEKLLFIGASLASALFLALMVVTLNSGVTRKSRKEHERLMSTEEEYRISAQQSGLVIIRYDTVNGRVISSQGAIDHFQFPDQPKGQELCKAFYSIVAQESRDDLAAFQRMMQEGESTGKVEICLMNAEGLPRWYAFEFSAIGDGGGANTQAIVTIRDITMQHERLAAYQRWQNVLAATAGAFDAMLEINLGNGLVERAEGEFLSFIDSNAEDCRAEDVLDLFERQAVDEKDRKRFSAFVSCSRLINLAVRGVSKDEAEIRLNRPDGTVRWCLATVQAAFFTKTNEGKALIMLKDMDDSRLEMERLSNLALHDGLTGLLNRTAARNEIEELLRFGPAERVALFMIDADNFKLLNDTLGHQHGDRALKQMALAIRSVFRASDLIARFGGDEFFVFLPEVPADDFAENKAAALCSALRLTYSVEDRGTMTLTASVGIVVAGRDTANFETLYAEADRALYDAKNAGKNRYSIRYADRPGTSRTCQPAQPDDALQLQSLMKHLDGGVIVAEIGEQISPLFMSEGYFRKLGVLDKAAQNGTFPISNVHPLDYAYVNEAILKCAKDGEPIQISYRNVLAEGGYGWRHLNAARIPSPHGSPPAVVGVISDITELKNATEHFESLAEQAQIGILIVRVGERLEITFFNDGALKISGFNYEQMRLFSRDAAAMFRGQNLEGFRAAVSRAEAENKPLEFAYQSGGFNGTGAHTILLYGVKLDVQNEVPSFLIFMLDRDAKADENRQDG